VNEIREMLMHGRVFGRCTKKCRNRFNSKIADGLYSKGWSQNEIDKYIADLLDEYDQTLDDPIDPEVWKYYMELLPRLSNAEQEYILNDIIADELYNEEWNKDEVSGYIDDVYDDMWETTDNQSYSKSTVDIRIDTTLPFYKKIIGFIRRKCLSKMKGPEELTAEVNDEILNDMRWDGSCP
jgi:hypothetical protein